MRIVSPRAHQLVLCLLIAAFLPAILWGQARESGSIQGKAADETGAVLPGVTVTATSPALQVPQVSAITDEEGNYKLLGLPAPGVYRLTFELPGMTTFVRGELNLSVGFTARVDAPM